MSGDLQIRQVPPYLAMDDGVDVSSTYAKLHGYRPLCSALTQLADAPHLFGGELSTSGLLSLCGHAKPLRKHVPHVVEMSPDKKVCRVYASGIVARVANVKVVRHGATNERQHKTVRANLFGTGACSGRNCQVPVPSASVAGPFPAPVGIGRLADFLPEAISNGTTVRVHTRKISDLLR